MSVNIRKMTDDEFGMFCRWSIRHHAKELTEDGKMPPEEAIKEAKQEIAEMLPEGLRTADNHLMTILEHHQIVGFIWTLHEETAGKKQSFLCDFVIWESKRRQDYGTAALARMEADAVQAGCRESVLFVADKNHAAQALYEKCGYRFLRQHSYGKYMIKQL